MRGVIFILVVLAAVSSHAFMLVDCDGEYVSVESVADLKANEANLACDVERTPRGTNMFGTFFSNEDIELVVAEHSAILRLEDGVLVGIAPERPRPSIEISCDESLVQEYIDAARWAENFDDVQTIVNECPVSAMRLSTVPAVTGLNVMFDQTRASLNLLGGKSDSMGVLRDASTLLFAMPLAVIEFGVQFVEVIV